MYRSVLALMLGLAHTLLRWPQRSRAPGATALAAALAYGLSPLALVWGRIAVSDALLAGCLGFSLLLSLRCYAAGGRRWWQAWLVLGLAVLAKGPVAVVLVGLSLLLFGWRQGDGLMLLRCLRPWPGLLLTALPELLRPVGDLRLIVFGAVILVGPLFFPQGVITPELFKSFKPRIGGIPTAAAQGVKQ